MYSILIIEDTVKIRYELKELLCKYGYDVNAPEDFDNIIDYTKRENPNLILLDINLPTFDGYHICREIRKTSSVPIIVVTSRDSEVDELMSMNLGADDFITKPYNVQILLSHIASVLRRCYESNSSNVLTYDAIKINLSKSTITINGTEYELTKNELKIINCLINNKGRIVSREHLMEYLWTSELFIDDNTLTVNINRLRKKLEYAGFKDAIETRRGLGYIMP
jgi:DNA-binding response OmpR family regulator